MEMDCVTGGKGVEVSLRTLMLTSSTIQVLTYVLAQLGHSVTLYRPMNGCLVQGQVGKKKRLT